MPPLGARVSIELARGNVFFPLPPLPPLPICLLSSALGCCFSCNCVFQCPHLYWARKMILLFVSCRHPAAPSSLRTPTTSRTPLALSQTIGVPPHVSFPSAPHLTRPQVNSFVGFHYSSLQSQHVVIS